MIRLLAFLLGTVACVYGADDDRLAAFRQELAAERRELADLREQTQAQIAELESSLAAAASNLVTAELAAQAAAAQAASERQAVAATKAELSEIEDALAMLEGARERAVSHADLLLSELPGTAARREALATASGPELLRLFEQLHVGATTTRVFKAPIYRPDGTPVEAELLAVGNAHFAYRLPDGTTALALQSPTDASGYRWLEDLDESQRLAIAAAIDAVKAGRAAMVPMDVTGTLRVESWRTDTTWISRVKAGGALMWPLALVALVAAVLIGERTVVWQRERGCNNVIADAMRACRERRFGDAEDTLQKRGKGVAARLLLAALARQPQGQNAMEDGIEVCLLQEAPKLRHRLSGIAVLGAVAPLLGLLGTVTGIIETFAVIKGSGTTDAGMMAGGISQALVTTAAGLVIAIPILLLHRVLSGAMDRIVSDAEFQAANALTVLSQESTENDG